LEDDECVDATVVSQSLVCTLPGSRHTPPQGVDHGDVPVVFDLDTPGVASFRQAPGDGPDLAVQQGRILKPRAPVQQRIDSGSTAVDQALPVDPNPPSPREDASKSSTTRKLGCTTGTITICAMRSIGWIVNASLPRFHTLTISWPW